MCYSAADGGQRCASHTRIAFERAERHLQFAKDQRFDEYGMDANQYNWEQAAIAYASTPEGREQLTARRDADAAAGWTGRAAHLTTILQQGQNLRDTNAAVRDSLRLHKRTIAERALGRPAQERTPEELEHALRKFHHPGPGGRYGH